MPSRAQRGEARAARRTSHGPRGGAWPLLVAIPLDVACLYLVLAALELVPDAWPGAERSPWGLLAAAVSLFAAARAIALTALGRLVRWRAASEAWSRLVSQRRPIH